MNPFFGHTTHSFAFVFGTNPLIAILGKLFQQRLCEETIVGQKPGNHWLNRFMERNPDILL